METKAVIFDLFGVLGETLNQKWILNNVADRPEVVAKLHAIMLGLDMGEKSQFDFCTAAAEAIGKTPDAVQQEMESGFHVYPAMFELAGQLRGTYKTAICSNASAPYASELFRMKGYVLNDHFDQVFISSEVMRVKPNLEMFAYCAEKLGVKLEECAFVDDAKSNVEAAENLGMKAHLFTEQASFANWVANNFI